MSGSHEFARGAESTAGVRMTQGVRVGGGTTPRGTVSSSRASGRTLTWHGASSKEGPRHFNRRCGGIWVGHLGGIP